MSVEFKLPEVSEGVESVDVAEVLVAEGDTIEADQVVCEVETDKAAAEIRCPHGGTVEQIHISPGDSVPIGGVLLTIGGDDASTAASSPSESAPAEPSAPPAADEVPTPVEPEPAPASAAAVAGGTVEFHLPEVSEGVESVDVAEVVVSAGDRIEADDVVCEVETDKAAAEIRCPHAGTIQEVHVTAGDTVAVGAVLLTIEATSAAAPAAAPAPPPSAVESAKPPKAVPAATSARAPARPDNGRPPAPAGPATRRLARKLGVDLYEVKGSGPGGRITLEDVEGYVRGRLESQASGGTAIASPPLPDFSKFGPIEREPMNKIARTSAANLSAAWVNIPHVTQHDLADITDLEAARKKYVKSRPDSPKVTMTAIMIKAVVGALKAFPKFNASIDVDAGELIIKNYYHVGVAVDTPHGLVVPVIRDCDQKNVLEVAGELIDMAVRARDKKLTLDEMQGATFTITNLGGIGGTSFTPIVNHPEVAILGMSRGRKELQIDDDQVVERLMLPLSLSYDHRVVNGADAARFIVKLSNSLSNFFELF